MGYTVHIFSIGHIDGEYRTTNAERFRSTLAGCASGSGRAATLTWARKWDRATSVLRRHQWEMVLRLARGVLIRGPSQVVER